MTHEEETLLIIKGSIADMAEEERAMVHAAAIAIRGVLLQHRAFGFIGLALVGAELAAQP
jgi:hypothetical protein